MKRLTIQTICVVLFLGNFVHAQVTPLLSTTWNQGCYYNAQCPTVSSGGACGRAYTGCNATAIAQIFKYYNYPESGMGGTHCNTNNISHCVDFDAQNYVYSAMPANLTAANAEVAKLMYDIGVAVNMQWSNSNSVSFFGALPMKKHFGYSPKMYGTATFMFTTTQDLIDAVKLELDAGRVVYCKSNTLNHFYLIDGYNASNEFHMNFGWGGVYDGYFPINSVLIPPGNATPHNFIFHIQPLSGTLEMAMDTITVPAGDGLTFIEFTSKTDWELSSLSAWLNPNQVSGMAGYFSQGDGVGFTRQVNHGPERIGYVQFTNATETKTVVVRQEASPLSVNPDTIFVSNTGGNESVLVEWFTYSNWNATALNSWIAVVNPTGAGQTQLNLSIEPNSEESLRTGYVVVTAGVYVDTLVLLQSGISTAGLSVHSEQKFLQYPNPVRDQLKVSGFDPSVIYSIEIIDCSGRKVLAETIDSSGIDVSNLQTGSYFGFLYSGVNLLHTFLVQKL